METIQINTYTINELNDKAKQKAISDEATIEEIEANDLKFTEDGKVFRY